MLLRVPLVVGSECATSLSDPGGLVFRSDGFGRYELHGQVEQYSHGISQPGGHLTFVCCHGDGRGGDSP